jgi:hypothetical protein
MNSDKQVAMADELAIRNLLARYSQGVDRDDWILECRCFTPDAKIDYGALRSDFGG